MSIAPSVVQILRKQVTLEGEGIDRMYLNVYVPRLQGEPGVVGFFQRHRGQPVASAALRAPRTRNFVAGIERFVKVRSLPVVEFRKGQRKDDVMAERSSRSRAAHLWTPGQARHAGPFPHPCDHPGRHALPARRLQAFAHQAISQRRARAAHGNDD